MVETMVSIKSASEKFGVPYQILRRLVTEKRLKHVRLSPGKNGKFLLRLDDVENYLEQHTYGG